MKINQIESVKFGIRFQIIGIIPMMEAILAVPNQQLPLGWVNW